MSKAFRRYLKENNKTLKEVPGTLSYNFLKKIKKGEISITPALSEVIKLETGVNLPVETKAEKTFETFLVASFLKHHFKDAVIEKFNDIFMVLVVKHNGEKDYKFFSSTYFEFSSIVEARNEARAIIYDIEEGNDTWDETHKNEPVICVKEG